jgi:hypothetical protein
MGLDAAKPGEEVQPGERQFLQLFDSFNIDLP